MRAQFVLQEVWTGLRRNLTMTVALIVVVAISLSLLGTGLLFVKQVDDTRTYWQGKVQLSIYLCTATSVSPQCRQNGPATQEQKNQLAADLRALPQVEHVYYESQEQAFQHFKQDFSRDPQFTSLVTKSEIPDSFQVKLVNTQADYSVVAGVASGRPGVDQVVDDASILSKFYALLDGARNAVVIVAVILIIAAVLLVANTIRLSAFNRRRETSIMRLVGASNFYVQLPFLVEGILAGMAGWLIAAGLLIAVKTLGLDSLQQYFPYNVQLSGADLVEVIVLAMVMGVLLCGATSFLTLRRYLLTGTEVKSLRAGRASLTDGFAQISDGEMWLHGVHIPEYAQGTWTNHEPKRPRKLLLHRKEIDKLASEIAERGFTLVPLSLYFTGGRAKVELALARGKRTYDKRQDLAQRDAAREVQRAHRRRG